MSTQALSPVVETVVDEKVGNGEMFTAHDVTLEVRNRGHRAYHNEVRDAVHDYFSRGGMGVAYTRTNVAKIPGNPFVYHSSVDDPENYNNIRNGSTAHAPQSASAYTVPTVPANTDSDDDDSDDDGSDDGAGQALNSLVGSLGNIAGNLVGSLGHTHNGSSNGHTSGVSQRQTNKNVLSNRAVDGRCTLSIPAPVIRNVGFKPGERVYAVASTNGVEIVKAQPPASAVFGKYTVDRNSQVRLTQSLLARAGIGGSKYDVAEAGDKVTVKLHS